MQNLNEQLNAVLKTCKHHPNAQISTTEYAYVCKSCAIKWGRNLAIAQQQRDVKLLSREV